MDHDVFRFLVKGKGREAKDFPGSLLLEKADFSRFKMHKYLWYFLNSQGQGRRVHFPIRAKPVLRWSAKQYIMVNGHITLAPQKPVEFVSFFIGRLQANKDMLQLYDRTIRNNKSKNIMQSKMCTEESLSFTRLLSLVFIPRDLIFSLISSMLRSSTLIVILRSGIISLGSTPNRFCFFSLYIYLIVPVIVGSFDIGLWLSFMVL